jgi:hypothetical protein
MKLKPTTLLVACVAAVAAAWLAEGQSSQSYEYRVNALAVRQYLGDAASQIAAEPLAVQTQLLSYANNEPLLLKARLALLRYPDLARRVLPLYGNEPEFQEVLLKYGETALPPIGYFMDHDLTSLEIRRALGERIEEVKRLYGRLKGTPVDTAATTPVDRLTPEQRGWYAIQFLRDDGYDFLSQFAVAPDGTAVWVQTERATEDLADFFLSGVRGLETKWRQGATVDGSDLGWAALDMAVIATSAKLARAAWAGRTAVAGTDTSVTAGRAAGFSEGMTRYGSRVMAGGGRLGVAIARYGAVPAAVYLMFRHPSLINATLTELGSWLGVKPWLVQFVFWFLALSIVLRVALLLLAPLSWLLCRIGWLIGALAARVRPTPTPRRQARIA